MTALLLALQVALPSNGLHASVTDARSQALWVHVDSATRAFLAQWRRAWIETQQHWPPEYTWPHTTKSPWYVGNDVRSGPLRFAAVHCHFAETPHLLRGRVILNSGNAQASCPTWYPPGLRELDDERLSIDGGLDRQLRPRIWAQRNALRVFLEEMADSLPDDVPLTGQRVALRAGCRRAP